VRQIEMHIVERANPGPCIDYMLYRKVVVVRSVNCRPHDERLGVRISPLSRQAEVKGGKSGDTWV
jgi:hypothetical protein